MCLFIASPTAVHSDLLAGLLFLSSGAGFTVASLSLLVRTIRFRRRAARVAGPVVATRLPSEGRRSECLERWLALTMPADSACVPWLLTVEFDDSADCRRQATVEVSPSAWARWYRRGDSVRRLYDSTDRRPVQVNRFPDQWFGPAVLGGLGLGFVAAGFALVCRLGT